MITHTANCLWYCYAFRPYWAISFARSSPDKDFMYRFQPGHQLMCQRQIRPKSDLGLRSYLARNGQLWHMGSAMVRFLSCIIMLNAFGESKPGEAVALSPAR